jgi:MFS family permease
MVERRIAAPPVRVFAAAGDPIATSFAEPTPPRVDGEEIVWGSRPDVVDEVVRVARVTADGDGARVQLEARYDLRIPYFGWLYRPLVRAAVRRTVRHVADVLEARALGHPEPPAPRRPVWLTQDAVTSEAAATIATIACALALAGFGGGLFTQTVDFVAKSFHASDADLGVALALTRIGTLVGIAGAALADRRGRRRIMLLSVAGVCAASAVTALAPNLALFTVIQVFVRGCVQLATVVGFIALTEEAPEGSRAFLLAIGGMAAGAGFAIGAAMLPVAEIRQGAWRVMFAVAGLGLLALPGLARRLSETGRYAAMAGRGARARAGELVDRTYGGRFLLVAAVVFLLGFFGTPSLQFTNRYLQDERGFTALGIVLLRAVTQGFPALAGIVAGGRLAESSGRKRIASRSTFVLAITSAGFFLWAGAGLWVSMLVATVAGSMSGPALTAFNTELFPTEIRGRAAGALLAAGVAGSALGLLLVGYLADPLGGVGRAIAVTCVVPVVVSIFLIPKLPEGRGRALDELSPPEV